MSITSRTRTRDGSCLRVILCYTIRLFSSVELACEQLCVSVWCESGALFQMSHLKLHTSHFTLHFSHATLHTWHLHFTLHTSSHLIWALLTSSQLISALLTSSRSSQLCSSHLSTAQLFSSLLLMKSPCWAVETLTLIYTCIYNYIYNVYSFSHDGECLWAKFIETYDDRSISGHSSLRSLTWCQCQLPHDTGSVQKMQELIQVDKKGQPLPKQDAWSAMSVRFKYWCVMWAKTCQLWQYHERMTQANST